MDMGNDEAAYLAQLERENQRLLPPAQQYMAQQYMAQNHTDFLTRQAQQSFEPILTTQEIAEQRAAALQVKVAEAAAAREAKAIHRTMTPYGDRVVLAMLPEARQRASGLYLPADARVRYDYARIAEVIDVGPLVKGIIPGDEVVVAPLADGVEIDVPGTQKEGSDTPERCRVVGERAVIAILNEKRPLEDYLRDVKRIYERIREVYSGTSIRVSIDDPA